mmetsp:Transcript_29534/g.44958  ORF Transcript_29534/g.44958 Transcript_29534/m.44958 type:complete len:80 (+) Transcript_29534:459-698(+)
MAASIESSSSSSSIKSSQDSRKEPPSSEYKKALEIDDGISSVHWNSRALMKQKSTIYGIGDIDESISEEEEDANFRSGR